MTDFYAFAGNHPLLTLLLACCVVSMVSAVANAFRPVYRYDCDCDCEREAADE